MSHLVLIDGHHLMYRAFYAIPQNLKTKNGELTNVLYGVASMTIAMLKIEEPTHVVFCFDTGEETFRHQENATYKEGRAETPDEFYAQIPRVLDMIDAWGLRHVSHPTYEADDFLCAYARAGEKEGMKVTIVTGDRDALQLATEQTRIAIPHKGYQAPEYLGPSEIFTKYGIRPDQVPSYKGLTGDASDNLPGVKGIGPKTAADLLQRFDTLHGVYEHLEEIKGAVREKLERDRESAFFCERMATLVCDFPLPLTLEDAELRSMPTTPLLEFFRNVEFNTLWKRFQSVVQSEYGKRHFVQDVVQALVAASSKKSSSDEPQLTMF